MFGWIRPKAEEPPGWKGSSAIARADYDPKTKKMVLYFTSDPRKGYSFANVPAGVWKGFMAAESKGKFYTAHIRGQYPDT